MNGLRLTMTHHRYAHTKDDKEEEEVEVDKNWQCGRDGGMDGMVAEGGWCLGSGAARPPDDKMELSGVK